MSQYFLTFPNIIRELLDEWMIGLPGVIQLFLLGGIALFIVFERGRSRFRISMFWMFVLSNGIFLLIQRPGSAPRIWLWLFALAVIWAAAGWVWLTQLVAKKVNSKKFSQVMLFAFSCMLIIVAFNFTIHRDEYFKGYRFENSVAAVDATEYFKSILTDDDIVLVSSHADATYWYYFNYSQIPEKAIRGIKNRPFRRLFVVVYPRYSDETLELLIRKSGPDLVFLKMETTKKVHQAGKADIYSIEANHSAIEKEFHVETSPIP